MQPYEMADRDESWVHLNARWLASYDVEVPSSQSIFAHDGNVSKEAEKETEMRKSQVDGLFRWPKAD